MLTEDGAAGGHVAFGNRLAATHYPAERELYRADLDPVDLLTGRREAPVATRVVTAKALGDGRVATVVADSGHGHGHVTGSAMTAPHRGG